MYIAIDFDGTIVKHDYPRIGEPVPEAIEWMKRWQELGAKLILFTMRSDGPGDRTVLTEAVDYIREQGICLYGVNTNPTQHHWTSSPKAYAQIFVDDAAFGCPLIKDDSSERPYADWSIIGPAIEKILLDK